MPKKSQKTIFFGFQPYNESFSRPTRKVLNFSFFLEHATCHLLSCLGYFPSRKGKNNSISCFLANISLVKCHLSPLFILTTFRIYMFVLDSSNVHSWKEFLSNLTIFWSPELLLTHWRMRDLDGPWPLKNIEN